MKTKIPRGFTHEVYYPNLADHGLDTKTIYHGVNKYLMTGLAAFTIPYYGAILERHQSIDNHRIKYLRAASLNPLCTKSFDDTIVLSESSTGLWIFWSSFSDNCGSVGRIDKKAMTRTELLNNIRQYLLEIPPDEHHPGRFSGCFLEIPVQGKTIIFQ